MPSETTCLQCGRPWQMPRCPWCGSQSRWVEHHADVERTDEVIDRQLYKGRMGRPPKWLVAQRALVASLAATLPAAA